MLSITAAQGLYEDNDSAHGFDHVMRVYRLAERMARSEGADLEIVRAAALLHDVGRSEQARTGVCHAAWGAQRARDVLAMHPPDRVDAVARAIAEHRFRGDNPPTSLEACVLYDADKLDAMGAVGIARAYAVAGSRHQRLWAEVDAGYATRNPASGRDDLTSRVHTPVHEYLFKLSKLKDGMRTESGSRLAVERHEAMVAFFERLRREVEGSA